MQIDAAGTQATLCRSTKRPRDICWPKNVIDAFKQMKQQGTWQWDNVDFDNNIENCDVWKRVNITKDFTGTVDYKMF